MITNKTTLAGSLYAKPTHEQLEARFRHIRPTPEQGNRMGAMREKILDTAKFIVDNTPCSTEQTRALNALDDAMFLANAAIARNEKPTPATAEGE